MELDSSFLAGVAMTTTMLGGFAVTMRKLGRMEEKFDIIWRWYLRSNAASVRGGRRKSDPRPDDREDHA